MRHALVGERFAGVLRTPLGLDVHQVLNSYPPALVAPKAGAVLYRKGQNEVLALLTRNAGRYCSPNVLTGGKRRNPFLGSRPPHALA